MKKFALKTLAVVLFISTSLASCNNDDGGETIMLKNSYLTSVEGPVTGTVNQKITLTTKYIAENGCGAFNQFNELQNGTTKTIDVQVKYTGANCGSTPTEITTPYTFEVIEPGTYTFKFKKNASQFITHVVTIE
ncbi:hypothetical protein [uncultured Flavobacterium sp.]|uniref:hypothetical protein n=1 Tax=uncultured Flavobacterium sp. TaxID=165435 RepID=UPI0025ED8BC1|nr:hypothetical protein [uncultured Flavobacterium sp.]